ncbi:hypothetical protein LCGC14_1621830, partial [marine sediment metagenome]
MKSKKICIGLIICLIGISPLILFHIQIIEERKTKAYLYDVFHRCDSIADWIASDCDIVLDSTQKVEGLYSIKMTADNNQISTMRYDRNVDWSEFGDLIFWVYHPGWTNEIGRIAVYTDLANYKIWEFDFAATWTERTIDLSSVPLLSGGTLDLSNIDFIIVAQMNMTFPGEDYYFDFFHGRTVDITSDITYAKITEELGVPSVAEFNIKGETLDTFQPGLEMEIYDDDNVLSWTGRILYPETILEGAEVVGKLKVIGSDSEFNNVYRKNFITVRDSDYILKNIIDNASPRFKYDDEIDNFTLTYKYDLKTKIRKMYNYLAMLERGVIHYKPDREIFFNKYNNLSPSPQIYTATYNFEDDADGGFPSGWTDSDGVDCETTIIASLDGHRKVIQLYDNKNGATAKAEHAVIQGLNTTFEFYLTKDSVAAGTRVQVWLYEGATRVVTLRLDADDLDYWDGAQHFIKINYAVVNTFNHYKLVLDDTANTFDVYVDGILEGADSGYENNSTSGIDKIVLITDSSDVGYKGFFDAIGVSTDPSYTVGDNLHAWTQATSYVKITSYTPAANRHITKTPVIGANNDLGQIHYVGTATDAELQKFGIIELQPWRDPEITNYTEAKQIGDNLQTIYSLDTQMISMLVAKKKHIQVGYTVKLSWNLLFNINLANFLVTKRVWYPITDICELELTDNILTMKAFNLMVINNFYDENAQEGYEHPDVPESAADGIVLPLRSIAELRAFDAFASSIGLTLFLHQDASADVAGYKLLDSLFPDDAKTEVFNATITADDQEIEQWVTVSGGIDVVFLHHGVYHLHGHGYKFSGTKDLRLYFKVYIRTAGGAETLIGTSEESSILPDAEAEIEVHTEIHEQALNLTDRIVVKIFAHLEGVGSNPVMYFYVEGNTLTRFSLPIDESSIKAYVDALNSTINQILMAGFDGFAKGSPYGAAYIVAFSDVNAGVSFTFYVGKGGSFKLSIIHSGTANNFGKTAGGVLDISYDVDGGLETW